MPGAEAAERAPRGLARGWAPRDERQVGRQHRPDSQDPCCYLLPRPVLGEARVILVIESTAGGHSGASRRAGREDQRINVST